jgi:hypothetical protein
MAIDPQKVEKGCWQVLLVWTALAAVSSLVIFLIKLLLIHLLA